MTFSVDIVVKNDRGIADTLQALEPLLKQRKNWEVVVVDASAPAALRDIKERFGWVKWFYFRNMTGKKLTIPEQRNMAVTKSTGDIVVFVDANCVPNKKWPSVIEKAFEKEGCEMVAGMVTSAGKKSTHDTGYEARQDNATLEECGAANLAVRKSIWRELGGFDVNLSYGEDVDFTWRARAAGYQIIFKKGAVISHDWGGLREEMSRAFRYGRSRITLYKKHPHRWRNLLSVDVIVLIYPVYLVLLPLTIWVPFYPLVIVVPLLKNIRHKPFKTTFLHLFYGAGVLQGLVKNM